MKLGTKIGCLLVAFSIVLSVWVISGVGNEASTADANGFVINGSTLEGYTGAGGAVVIPSGVTAIESGVFANNPALTSVDMADTVTVMGSGVFSGCTNLTSVRLSSNLGKLPDNTFSGCTSLTSATIGKVASIGSSAFYGCTSLPMINIPASVTSIAGTAFDGCSSMISMDVSGSSTYYTSVDGALYNISGSKLIRVPEGKSSLKIPESCKTIGTDAFKNCSALSSVTIPASVTKIGTQSNWGIASITGDDGSAAETFALENGIAFSSTTPQEPLGESSEVGVTFTTEDGMQVVEMEDDESAELEMEFEDEDTQEEPAPSTGDSGNSGASDSGNTGTSSGGNSGSTSGGASGSGGHVKDATPTTADGDIDPRYFLSLGFLLIGAAVILYSKRSKISYIQSNRKK